MTRDGPSNDWPETNPGGRTRARRPNRAREKERAIDLQLTGKRALVTGASRGIGLAIARQLAAEGVTCAIAARSAGPLDEAAASVTAQTGTKVVAITADVTNTESVDALVAEAVIALGGIDIAVNNAARVSGGEPDNFAGVTEELLLDDFNTKVVGYLRVPRSVAPIMRATGWGRIINISGLAARNAGAIAGGARNASVVNLTKNLSLELGKDGITVNAIYPTLVLTEVIKARYEKRAADMNVSFAEASADSVARTAIGRFVEPAEIAYAVAFLASPLAGAITGDVIAVTGGAGSAVYY